MPDLSDADPVAVVIAHLLGDAEVSAVLGGPGRVSGIVEGPWPHVVVTDGSGGDLRGLRGGSMVGEVAWDVYGPLDGSLGPAAIKRAAMKVALSIKRLAELPHVPGQPVVADVDPVGSIAKQPLSSGQPRYSGAFNVTISPPQ